MLTDAIYPLNFLSGRSDVKLVLLLFSSSGDQDVPIAQVSRKLPFCLGCLMHWLTARLWAYNQHLTSQEYLKTHGAFKHFCVRRLSVSVLWQMPRTQRLRRLATTGPLALVLRV